jgi:hypothetical protein
MGQLPKKDVGALIGGAILLGLFMYGEGKGMGGETGDLIAGTWLLHGGQFVAVSAAVVWLWWTLRPLWTLKLPRGFVIAFHHRDKRGPAPVWGTDAVALPARPFSTWIKFKVARPVRCYGFAVETTAPIGMAYLTVQSGPRSIDGWEEVLSQPHCANFVRKDGCALGAGDRLEIHLESSEPVDLERLRLIKKRSASRLTQFLD